MSVELTTDSPVSVDLEAERDAQRARILQFAQKLIPARASKQHEYLRGDVRFSELTTPSREALLYILGVAGAYMRFKVRYVTMGKGRWIPSFVEVEHPKLGTFPLFPAEALPHPRKVS